MLDTKEKLERSVERTYEDFEWLHHSFLTHVDTAGLIVSPPPAQGADTVVCSIYSQPVIISNHQHDSCEGSQYLRK